MDRNLATLALTSISLIAFFAAYQLSSGDVLDDRGSAIVQIVLNGDSISVDSNRHLTVEGSKVTIKSAGTYSIEGTLTDGQIVVSTKDEETVTIVLAGVNINCSTGSPIYVSDAKRVVIFLEAESKNFVSDEKSYVFGDLAVDEPNAAVFSKSDLIIMGDGMLSVIGKYNDGIASKDGLLIQNGTIQVRSVDDGIRGKDYLVVRDGNLDLDVGGDGLKSDNALDSSMGYVAVENGKIAVVSKGDAIQAEGSILITGGSFDLESGGGSSYIASVGISAKCIKGNCGVTIDGGHFVLDSADDGIHSNGTIRVNGGSFVLSSGDDAIHADGSVEINGGDIEIVKSVEGIEGGVVTIRDGGISIVSSNDGIDAVASANNANSGVASIVHGTINIVSGGDAIQAGTRTLIEGGEFVLTSGGGSNGVVAANISSKGIKAVESVIVEGGKLTVNSADDVIHSNGIVAVNGGSFVLSSGDDAIHADGSVEINGGDIEIVKSVEGIEGGVVTIRDGGISIVSSNDGIDAVASANNANLGVFSVVDGVITIRSGGDAIKAEKEVLIADGIFSLSSGKDAIQSETNVLIDGGSFSLTSVGDAIQAGANVLIKDGSFSLSPGGGSNRVLADGVSAKGVKGTVGVTINGGVLNIDSADDGIHSDGQVTVNGGSLVVSTGDDAVHADSSITINKGEVDIKTCYEGIEAPEVTVNGGTIHIKSSDDGINLGVNTIQEHEPFSSTYNGDFCLYINGGYISIESFGDGIDSNGAVVMTNGIVLVESPWSIWHSAFDHAAFNITGGSFITVGSSNFEQTPGNLSTQHSVMLNFTSANQAGTLIHVQNNEGSEVFTFKPSRQYRTVVFSMPSLTNGTNYSVHLGGTHTGILKDGLYSGGTYTLGMNCTNFTISEIIMVVPCETEIDLLNSVDL